MDMKNLITSTKLILCFLIPLAIWNTACKELDDIGSPVTNPSPSPTPNPVDVSDLNKLNASLSLANKIIHLGQMPRPDSGSTPILDFKVNQKTVPLINDFPYTLQLLKPYPGFIIQSLYGQVKGSDEYMEFPMDVSNENDTLVLLEISFDQTGWEPPFSFDLDFVPVDDSGSPLDEIAVEVEVISYDDQVTAPANACGDIMELLFQADSTSFSGESAKFRWFYTHFIQPNSTADYMAPNKFFGASGTSNGCCTSQGSSHGDCIGLPTHGTAEYEFGITYFDDYLTFRRDGTMGGTVSYLGQNIDVENTDYCGGVAAYFPSDSKTNSYDPTTAYSIDPECYIILDPLRGESETTLIGGQAYEWPLQITAGSGSQAKYYFMPTFNLETGESGTDSKHLVEERYDPETRQPSFLRIYERVSSVDRWLD